MMAEKKIDFIENNTIKTTGKQQDEAPKLLVIPLPKPNKPVIPVAPPANAGQSKQPNPQEASQSAPDGSETLEQRAAREIVEQTADAIVKKNKRLISSYRCGQNCGSRIVHGKAIWTIMSPCRSNSSVWRCCVVWVSPGIQRVKVIN